MLQDFLDRLIKPMEIMIAISLMFFISSFPTIASNCVHPLDFYRYDSKMVGFKNIIEKIKEALQKTNLTEVENPLIKDFNSNENTSVEYKVARKGSLEICAVSRNSRKCFEVRCDCKDVSRQQGNGPHSSNASLLCKATKQNDSLQDRSCQKHNTVNTTSKNETSNHHQLDVTSSNAVKTFNDQKTGSNSTTSNLMQTGKDKDVSPWFTTAVFVGGFVSGLIISMTFSYICHKRKSTGVEKEKPEYSTGQDRPLISTQLQVADSSVYSEISNQKQNNKLLNNDNTGNPLYSSPVYVGEYVEPVTRNGNARFLQENQSNVDHNLPTHAMYTETIGADQTGHILDLCNNEYSHLQFNGESQFRTQGKKEYDETSNEAKAESTENNQTEHDEGPVDGFDDTIKILDEQQRGSSEIGSHSACVPSALSDLSDKERKEIANNANQLSDGKENEYFVLEKNES